MKKKDKSKKVYNFLKQDLYLVVFSLLVVFTLFGYFYAQRMHNNPDNSLNVLGTNHIRGLWTYSLKGNRDCPDDIDVDFDRCVFSKEWDSWSTLEYKEVRVGESHENITVDFNRVGRVDNDLWPGVFSGSYIINIGEAEYKYQSSVFDSKNNLPIVYVLDKGDSMLVLIKVQKDMVGRSFRLSGYGLSKTDGVLSVLKFRDSVNIIEINEIFFVKDGKGNEYVLTNQYNPSMQGSVKYDFFNMELNLLESVLVVDEY